MNIPKNGVFGGNVSGGSYRSSSTFFEIFVSGVVVATTFFPSE